MEGQPEPPTRGPRGRDQRILRLERELDEARREAAALREAVQSSVEATHRQYRRDLVPVQNTIALFVAAQRQRRGGV